MDIVLHPVDIARINERRKIVRQLLDDGYERWDMPPNGDERFRKGEQIVTLKWNAETLHYETDK